MLSKTQYQEFFVKKHTVFSFSHSVANKNAFQSIRVSSDFEQFEVIICVTCIGHCALESVFFELFLKSHIPYSSWGLGVHMKLLGANHFDDTAKPSE